MRNLNRAICLILLCTTVGCYKEVFRTEVPPGTRVEQPPAMVEDDITLYFSPKGGGMAAIIKEIDNARKSIHVMAYLMSTREVADPLVAAHKRGVDVNILIDEDDIGGIFSWNAILKDTPLKVFRDGEHKEYHHKVMLIDGNTIITGSFNFSSQAEDTNAENLLIIRNKPKLYGAYMAEFNKHLAHSEQSRHKAAKETAKAH